MSPTVEFGSKAAADDARERWGEHLCPDDDRRLKTVRFVGDVPEQVMDRARLEAAESLEETESGPGQEPLTDHERDRIDFGKGRANVPWARTIKAIAAAEGVDDWTAHVDPTLTVDEHREVMTDAAREGGGSRMDADDSAREKAGRHSRRAQSNECDHASGHCENGDPDACEFLTEVCGYEQSTLQNVLLAEREPERPDPTHPEDREIEGEAAGALKRSWGGYQAAVSDLVEELERARTSWKLAQQAARAINEIRLAHGQEPLDYEKLERAQAALMDLARLAAADCVECHADHSQHDHDVSTSPVEDIREFVDEGRASTPVGSGGDRGEDPTDFVDDRSDPSRGVESEEQATEQHTFRDPTQHTL